MTTIGYTLIDIFSAALVLSLLSLEHPLARLLNLKPLRRLGEISYGFYVFHDMFHGICIRIVQRLFGPDIKNGGLLMVTALAFVITLVLATLSFRYFESPFLRLKSRFAA